MYLPFKSPFTPQELQTKTYYSIYESSFVVLGPCLWNTLPAEITTIDNSDALKEPFTTTSCGTCPPVKGRQYACVNSNSITDWRLDKTWCPDVIPLSGQTCWWLSCGQQNLTRSTRTQYSDLIGCFILGYITKVAYNETKCRPTFKNHILYFKKQCFVTSVLLKSMWGIVDLNILKVQAKPKC